MLEETINPNPSIKAIEEGLAGVDRTKLIAQKQVLLARIEGLRATHSCCNYHRMYVHNRLLKRLLKHVDAADVRQLYNDNRSLKKGVESRINEVKGSLERFENNTKWCLKGPAVLATFFILLALYFVTVILFSLLCGSYHTVDLYPFFSQYQNFECADNILNWGSSNNNYPIPSNSSAANSTSESIWSSWA